MYIYSRVDYDKEMYNRSTFYRRQVDELEEIEKHKWFESEKLGHDVGGNRATLDWMRKFRTVWNSEWAEKNKKSEDSSD